MEPLTRIEGRVLPLDRDDVDTDQIMPKQFLSRVERTGFGDYVFYEWRRDPAFVFNDDRFTGASVLVSGRNFGSGSSREHAVWGLQQFGIQAVIAPSFSDIFAGNCIQTGLLPAQVDITVSRELIEQAQHTPTMEVTVDLESRRVEWPGGSAPFSIADQYRTSLLTGLDDVGSILLRSSHIDEYESTRASWMPSVAT